MVEQLHNIEKEKQNPTTPNHLMGACVRHGLASHQRSFAPTEAQRALALFFTSIM
jgi:hypothetical protein